MEPSRARGRLLTAALSLAAALLGDAATRPPALGLLLAAQRDAVLPSCRIANVAAVVRAARPTAPDLFAALAAGRLKDPPPGEDPLRAVAATLADLARGAGDDKAFKKLLKQALGGKRKQQPPQRPTPPG